ncbi:hypothetical protein HK102_012365, partial [Quaeritorhiza haematococci]
MTNLHASLAPPSNPSKSHPSDTLCKTCKQPIRKTVSLPVRISVSGLAAVCEICHEVVHDDGVGRLRGGGGRGWRDQEDEEDGEGKDEENEEGGELKGCVAQMQKEWCGYPIEIPGIVLKRLYDRLRLQQQSQLKVEGVNGRGRVGMAGLPKLPKNGAMQSTSAVQDQQIGSVEEAPIQEGKSTEGTLEKARNQSGTVNAQSGRFAMSLEDLPGLILDKKVGGDQHTAVLPK